MREKERYTDTFSASNCFKLNFSYELATFVKK